MDVALIKLSNFTHKPFTHALNWVLSASELYNFPQPVNAAFAHQQRPSARMDRLSFTEWPLRENNRLPPRVPCEYDSPSLGSLSNKILSPFKSRRRLNVA